MYTGAATYRSTAALCALLAAGACSKKQDDATVDAGQDLSDVTVQFDEAATYDIATIDVTYDASVDSSGSEPPPDEAAADQAAGPEVDAGPAADSSTADASILDAASDATIARDDAWVEGGPSEIIANTPYAVAAAFADPPVSHGHVLFGSETLYISHLPSWTGPHAYQAETAIVLDDGARSAYLKDRASSGTSLYTVMPDPFTMPSLIAPDAASFTVSAGVYRGDGTQIASATLSAPRSIHFRHLDPTTPRPAEPAYLLFGSPTEAFLVHLFTTEPDFGQILAVQLSPPLAADARLATGLQLRLPGQAPTVPLKVGATPAVRIADTADVTTLTVVAEIFLDLNDLP
jgi:hypothetical protein